MDTEQQKHDPAAVSTYLWHCPECGKGSNHPMDARFGYCGQCKKFVDDGA